jgi:hypothetical protein
MSATTIPATIRISQDGRYAGTGRLVRHPDGTVTVEDCYAILGPDGLDHESGEQQDAAERAYEAIEAAIARGESSVAIDGCTYTWQVEEPPTIEVLGLGDQDWGSDEYADAWETDDERGRRGAARQWERYGTVRVQIGDVEYQVGCCIGVPAALRATAEAAGGDTTRPAYLDAWYVDASDWSCAPASHGPEGVPSELRDAVLAAIYDARVRLWSEYEEERADVA